MGTRSQHSPKYRRLCKLLRAYRAQSELTQRALALRLRQPHSYVYKVEHGERRIDPVEFVAWCKACRVDPAEAIGEIE